LVVELRVVGKRLAERYKHAALTGSQPTLESVPGAQVNSLASSQRRLLLSNFRYYASRLRRSIVGFDTENSRFKVGVECGLGSRGGKHNWPVLDKLLGY